MGSQIELTLEPSSGRFDETDDRWLDQVAGLVRDLECQVDVARRPRDLQPGAKGILDQIVVPLASAGVLTATADILKAWLSRDRTRSVRVSLGASGAVQQFELSGSAVDDEAFDDVVASVLAAL